MATTARFVKAADNSRPHKSHRYDVFGPKIQRNLTLFGLAQVQTWLLLESDPLVLSYCERPMVAPETKPKLVVDFWAGYAGRDELWIVSRNPAATADIGTSMPAFARWAEDNKYDVRQLAPPGVMDDKVYLDNWGIIVRELSANRRYIKPSLLKAVREILEQPRPIAALCNLLPQEDPVLVRVAAYSLLHSGLAFCSDIAVMPLGPASTLELA